MTDTLDISAVLRDLPGWREAEGDRPAIARSLTFPDFNAAFGFMTRVALHAAKVDHHPEWSNVYRTVEVKLTTHSAKGLTELDFDLAGRMDKAARH